MSTAIATSIDVALLGCGNVGSAFARLASRPVAPIPPVRITGAFVRQPSRRRDLRTPLAFTANAGDLLHPPPHVVVELLGGVEPARTVLLEALGRRIPVVTANKTLLARHGSELRAAGARHGTPLLDEAAVIAGVPFLGTFARRPLAACATGLTGIVNGTSNFVLTQCARLGTAGIVEATAAAQRLGYAEPDPHNDLAGIDAAEKLVVLLQHFAGRTVDPDAIHTVGIEHITADDLRQARLLDGAIKPVILARWTDRLEAFVGPAFVPAAHVLSRVDGVENALLVERPNGRLLFQGPGAGPDATAATVLDDVREIAEGARPPRVLSSHEAAGEPETGWMVRFEGTRLPRPADVLDLLASYGVYAQRVTPKDARDGRETQAALLWPAPRPRIAAVTRALENASGISTSTFRSLEAC